MMTRKEKLQTLKKLGERNQAFALLAELYRASPEIVEQEIKKNLEVTRC